MSAKLFDRDWRFITDSLYYLYGAETLADFEKETLERLRVIIPASHSMFTVIHESYDTPTTFSDIYSIGERARYLEEFMSGKYDHDPYFQSWDSFMSTSVFRDTDMMPDSYRVTTPLYRNIYAKQGIHYAMRIYAVYEGKTIGNISSFRSKMQGDFSDHEIEIARMMAPHITQKLTQLLSSSQSKNVVLGDIKAFEKYRLTPKEREVVGLLLEDMNDGQIAEKLSISRATLKTHIYNIYRKTNVKSRLQLMILAKQ